MKYFFILPLAFLSCSDEKAESSSSEIVYICNGPSSKRYHYDKNCFGLNNCSTTLQKTSKTEAKSMGRNLCGYE